MLLFSANFFAKLPGGWGNGVGLCGDATRQGIPSPAVRQRCIGAPGVPPCQGPPVHHLWTPEPCLENPGVWGKAPALLPTDSAEDPYFYSVIQGGMGGFGKTKGLE